MGTDQITVGNWHRNPQGKTRFIEVGEGLLEATNQGEPSEQIQQKYL